MLPTPTLLLVLVVLVSVHVEIQMLSRHLLVHRQHIIRHRLEMATAS